MDLDLRRLDGRPHPRLDVLFVHGLASDAESAWRHQAPPFYWPEGFASDGLLEPASIWTLAYPSDATRWGGGGSGMGLADRASNVLKFLTTQGIGRRPLVMIAHSLGGLLAKQMLRMSVELGTQPFEDFAANTRGIVFLATPHAGSSLASLGKVLRAVGRPTQLTEDLAAHDQWLRQLTDWYRLKASSLGVRTDAYSETRQIKGLWVVDPTSADPHAPDAIVTPMDADHVSIAKPDSSRHPLYVAVRDFVLRRLAESEPVATATDRLPAGTDELFRGLRSAWSETLFTAQDPVGGGFRTQVLDAETPSQAWSSAQALVALFAVRRGLDRVERLRAAFEYIERDRRDGGWTIVDGPHQEAVTEIAAWVTVAHCAALDSGLLWSGAETAAVEARIDRDVALLRSLQDASGGWSPVRHLSTRNLRTYSSITALWALAAVARRRGDDQLAEPLRRGLAWLWATRKPDLGWVPNPSRPRQHDRYVGLDAQIVAVLLSMEPGLSAAAGRGLLGRNPAFEAAKRDLLDAPELMSRRFGHNDRVDNLDQAVEGSGFLLEGSSFLWCPWSLRAITLLQRDQALDPGQRQRAGEVRQRLAECLFEGRMEVGDRGTFEVAEALLSLADPEAGDPA